MRTKRGKEREGSQRSVEVLYTAGLDRIAYCQECTASASRGEVTSKFSFILSCRRICRKALEDSP